MDGCFVGLAPVFFDPVLDPMLIEGVGEVFGVGYEGDGTGFGECFEAYDGTEEFHTVVGREFEAFGVGGFVKDSVFVDVMKDGAVAAGAGVSFGGTV